METVILIASVVVATISAIFAWRAVGEAAKQNNLSYKAIQAQTMVMIFNHAREFKFSQGMDAVRKLNYKDYEKFKKMETEEVQKQIRSIVDFFNDLMHLIEHDYITREHVIQVYKVSLRDCREHLLDWWVDGFREENGNNWYYISFKKICEEG